MSSSRTPLRHLALALTLAFACEPKTAESPALDASQACRQDYPSGPYGITKGDVVEDLRLDGLRDDGTKGTLAFAGSYGTCGGGKVLVVRVQAGFCGTCRTAAQTTADLPPEIREHVRIIDVVVRDEDAEPADVATAERWRTLQDVKTSIAIDPAMRLVVPQTPLPRVLVIDPRTMKIRDTLGDPPAEHVANAAASVLAEIRGEPPPAPRDVERFDGRFTKRQWRMIREMTFSGAPPMDPTNAVGDRAGPAALGRDLFKDRSLSPTGETSCERCHETHRFFTDGSETATGGAGGAVRNTPSVLLSAWSRWQLWDGRADTLWMQALLPIEDAKEFASSRLFVAHRIFDAYREPYEAIFGPMPPLDDYGRFPYSGKPGDAAWEGMTLADQTAVTKIFVDIGKSIAAFERSLRMLPIAIDRYAGGELTALSDAEKDGLSAFFATGCAQCHWGSRLTDDAFHVMRFPSGKEDLTPDDGRIRAAATFAASEFRGDGAWSDAKLPPRKIASDERLLGAFKTPALRGVAPTAPYGHGGSVPSLKMAVDLHRTLGMPAGNRMTNGVVPPWLVPFDAAQTAPLLAFLRTLGFGR